MKRTLTLLITLICAAAGWAEVVPTTIADGKFAEGTQWYFMNIGAGRLNIAYSGDGEKIKLGNSVLYTAQSDASLWCVVQEATGIYKIYNKAAGPEKALTCPSGVGSDGNTGGSSFPTVKAVSTTAKQSWRFSEGHASVSGSYYVAEKSNSSWVMNNRGGMLAFWTGGKDAGSAITFVTPEEHDAMQEPLRKCFDETGAIFVYNDVQTVQYRIPAIAVTKSGTLIAVNDYRYCGADIGNGRIDLHVSRSTDGGKSWSFPDLCRDKDGKAVTQGTGEGTFNTSNEHRDCGFGDACIVGDRESERVLMMSVCGRTPFFSARRAIPNSVARWYSEDGGLTWTPFQDITDHIYTQFDGTVPYGYIDSMFFGSGRIMQSSTTKVGEYYRLYAVLSGRHEESKNIANWVMYSDNFGETWAILGDPMTPAIPSGADEPKCEELPDGSIVVTSRTGGGRQMNIFSFTNIEKGEGYWDSCAKSNLVKASSNACNGETLIVPVKKVATGEQTYLLMQSVPFGPSNRSHVGINYKELSGYDDYGTVTNIVKNWDGAYEVTTLSSAYSTMVVQADHNIAFFYEEGTYSKDYSDVYKCLSVETITGGAYTYSDDTDFAAAKAQMKEIVAKKMEAVEALLQGSNAFLYSEEKVQAVRAAVEAFNAAPSTTTYCAVNAAIKAMSPEAVATLDEVSNNEAYLLYNPHFTSFAIYAPTASKTSVWTAGMTGDAGHAVKKTSYSQAIDVTSANTAWMLVNHADKWYLYNVGAEQFVSVGSPTKFTKTATAITPGTVSGGFSFITTQGNQNYMCVSPQLDNPISTWTAGDAGSCWQLIKHPSVEADLESAMQVIDPTNSIGEVISSQSSEACSVIYDLTGRVSAVKPETKGILIQQRKKIII